MDQRIGFIGAGQMAKALAKGFLAADLLSAEQLTACDPSKDARMAFEDATGAKSVTDHQAVAAASDVVIIAVKPHFLEEACDSLKPALDGQLVVSIVAGASLDQLSRLLGTERLVRVMPNTPCLIGSGASGYALGAGADPQQDQAIVQQLLEGVGVAFCVPEQQLDAVTGLSGSGPAYVFMMLEAMADGGVRMGLPRAVAIQLAAHTLQGAAALQIETGDHPGALKDQVASPGGTTIAGIHVLEDHGFRGAVISAVQAATERAEQL